MQWVTIGIAHWNTDLIQSFSHTGGRLVVWWQGEGEANPEYYKDPDRKMYNQLCQALGLHPLGVVSDG